MKYTAVCKLMLGRTRDAGWVLYNSETFAFDEMTPSKVYDLVEKKQVNGLCIRQGLIELDREEYGTQNIMVRSGVGNYRPLFSNEMNSYTDELFYVTRVYFDGSDNGPAYEVVSSKCARLLLNADGVHHMLDKGIVYGVIRDEEGLVLTPAGVDFIDMIPTTDGVDDIDSGLDVNVNEDDGPFDKLESPYANDTSGLSIFDELTPTEEVKPKRKRKSNKSKKAVASEE